MSEFLNKLKEETTLSKTEKGANTFSTTLDYNLDFFSRAGAMRDRTHDAKLLFKKAYIEDRELALKNLVHLRNIRLSGLGERAVYNESIKGLAELDLDTLIKFTEFMSEIGRWDDVVSLYRYSCETKNKVLTMVLVELISEQLELDKKNLKSDESISLLAKWLPSESSPNKEKKHTARDLSASLGYTSREYRKLLSALRAKLNLVETSLADKDYDTINFDKLPSRALFKYRGAFRKHLPSSYEMFINRVNSTDKKLNASNIMPYELVKKYTASGDWDDSVDDTVEATWKSLPNYVENMTRNAIVVSDVSGSMYGGAKEVSPMDVSISLGLYCAERLNGVFKDHFITFSSKPTLVHVPSELSLRERVSTAISSDWGMSTNLEAVFNLILNTATKSKLPQSELPTDIVIISDMEFDQCSSQKEDDSSFYESMRRKFSKAGYLLPTVTFWNVNSRNDNSPVRFSESGVALVSGITPTVFKHVMSLEKNTPKDFMVSVLRSEAYSFIDGIL
ncbi:RNA-binding protein [Listeria phage LP-048]|uniref:DUF2828 domain containing protein n=2 Tax=Pecentumvirus LP048 TaxID=2560557 RepID=A0A5C2IBX6_9CAUD|nr:RNA-binding protein [Listeria phage LP-048]AHL19732.1 DUF2828 domain-containing protein [Listeria phage LP-048]QEP53056.2 hypothetical protein FK485_0056 [Listeria phage LP-039]